MTTVADWRRLWEDRSRPDVSNFEFDRGRPPGNQEIEAAAYEEMLACVQPSTGDMILDAGCGSGANIHLLNSYVSRIIGMDYADGAMRRCQRRVSENNLGNAQLLRGTITEVPLSDSSVDKILCLSVLQYLTDEDVRSAFRECGRVLRDGGHLILHVKNLSSLYLSTLVLAKTLKNLLRGGRTTREYFRGFAWYKDALRAAGFEIVDFSSSNLLIVEGMPRKMVEILQKLERRCRPGAIFERTALRRLGSELKIRAVLRKAP